MSDHESVLRLKKWLIMGLRVDSTDPSSRTMHLACDARSLTDGLSPDELEAELAALPP